jgi:hypothetical protein
MVTEAGARPILTGRYPLPRLQHGVPDDLRPEPVAVGGLGRRRRERWS